MSKKRPINNDSENLLKGIGERLKKQKERKHEDEEATNEKENKDSQEVEKETEDRSKEKETKDKVLEEDDWNSQEDNYKTTYTVKPYMEDNYNQCKRRFRKELRTLLTRQDAIELGWLLLKKLDDAAFEEVRSNYSPEDDSIQALKNIIEELY